MSVKGNDIDGIVTRIRMVENRLRTLEEVVSKLLATMPRSYDIDTIKKIGRTQEINDYQLGLVKKRLDRIEKKCGSLTKKQF